ncbi:MAG: hypothetical protein KAW83_02560 [Dehalococcoidia bacterium]|nr:hypothetical protein [Dehalococcoidia bacterium]
MSENTFRIIIIVVAAITVISMFFPYQRFNIADKYVRIVRIIVGAVLLGLSVAWYLLY